MRDFDPAFPLMHPTDPSQSNGGMTKREYIATAVIAALAHTIADQMVRDQDSPQRCHLAISNTCRLAYVIADVMIKQGEQ